jgi:hypothetical protein
VVVVDVLEDLRGHDPVELTVGEGQLERVPLLDVGRGTLRHLAGLLHRTEQLEHARELVGVLVEGDHVGATPVHLEGVPAGAAAHVDHPVAGLQAQAVEVNGQHEYSRSWCWSWRWPWSGRVGRCSWGRSSGPLRRPSGRPRR